MRIENRHIMQGFAVTAALIFGLSICAGAHAQTSSLSCPPGYALSIDAPPPPTNDPTQPAAPVTPEQAKADEMSRWHCVPMTAPAPAQQ
jgi:hypothetical protein